MLKVGIQLIALTVISLGHVEISFENVRCFVQIHYTLIYLSLKFFTLGGKAAPELVRTHTLRMWSRQVLGLNLLFNFEAISTRLLVFRPEVLLELRDVSFKHRTRAEVIDSKVVNYAINHTEMVYLLSILKVLLKFSLKM